MDFTLTNSSKNVLDKIKEVMIKQFENKDISRYKLKFTKKKEFIAVPFAFTSPAFRLFINRGFHRTYIFKDNKWKSYS